MMDEMNLSLLEYTTKNTNVLYDIRDTYVLCATACVSHTPNAALYSIGTDVTVS